MLTEQVEALQQDRPDVEVALDCADAPPVRAHPALPRAIDEVLDNAVEHNDPDVEVAIDCELLDDVRLSIADTGSGIPSDETDVLFQRAETALEHGEGLGLWLLYWTVRKSDGELSFRQNEPTGTVVQIVLPLAE